MMKRQVRDPSAAIRKDLWQGRGYQASAQEHCLETG